MIQATIRWKGDEAGFIKNQYSRAHVWAFDGGMEVAASSSPDIVPVPMSDARNVDPEEAFVASLSSCHMLWFLSIAARAGYVVRSYEDSAIGQMDRNKSGKSCVSLVTLRPKVIWGTDSEPDADQISHLHHQAHDECFIANSVKTEIRIEIE